MGVQRAPRAESLRDVRIELMRCRVGIGESTFFCKLCWLYDQ